MIQQSLTDILSSLFAREEFTARLLERSFHQPIGWIELGLALFLTGLAYFLSERCIRSNKIKSIRLNVLRHSAKRIMFPLLMLGLGILVQISWQLFDLSSVWLRFLVLAAYWMILIRLVLSLIHAALPKNRWVDNIERSASGILWVCFLLWVSGIDDLILKWMRNLQFTIGKNQLNLLTILTGLLWVGVVLLFMTWFARWVNGKLMHSQSLDINLRIVLSKIISTAAIVLSILIALPLVGIDLTILSVFGGALGVGLGFGLQKIASNYVSGFIILADRSIRPGDRLTVNNFTGYVTEITSRFVVLRSTTGQEALIPNETFVTSTVVNESYTGKALYQSLNVQVAYHTDLVKAMRILKEAAAEQDRVGKDSPPNAFLTNFGENGIDLRVGFWVNDPENGFAGLYSAILMTIWQRFNEEGIEFPFPQREVRILPDEQNPSDLALLKAKIHAQGNTHSAEPLDDEEN